MSVQAGVWTFNGKPTDERWIRTMSRELAQHGPDGEGVYRAPGLAMLYRPFHTTLDSRLEQQPYRSPLGVVITWDGRLDNRVELLAELEGYVRDDRTDVAIAAAAYERWGEQTFAKLVGDFALVIWDESNDCLYLTKDFAGPKHLYYVLTATSVRWSSRLDTLVLHGGGPWTIDQDWLGTYLMYRPDAYHTPYAEIRAVGPATFSKIQRGKESIRRYWKWEPTHPIRYRTDAEYEAHFRHLFRQAVKRRLRTDSPVLAELSGGIDSSCIVCMADRIAADGGADTPRVDTLSYIRDPDGSNATDYVRLIEQQRGRIGTRVVADHGVVPPIARDAGAPFYCFPGSSTAASEFDAQQFAVMTTHGSRVVLSGLAGDEVLGGIPSPAGQLADALIQGRGAEFVTLLRAWSRIKKLPMWQLTAVAARKLFPKGPGARPGEVEPWLAVAFARRLRLARRYRSIAPEIPRHLLPSQRAFANAFESERQILTLHTLPVVGVAEKRYPYTDRDLVEFLFSIPNAQLLRPGERRSLLRRAMKALVPEALLARRAKAGGKSSLISMVHEHGAAVMETVRRLDGHVADCFDSAALERALRAAAHGRHTTPLRLLRAIDVVFWMDDLVSRGIVEMRSSHGPGRERNGVTATRIWNAITLKAALPSHVERR